MDLYAPGVPSNFKSPLSNKKMSAPNLANQSWNRRLYDGCKTSDDLRVTTGPGRYQLDAPPQYCNASYAPEPTIRQQSWGASLNSVYAKTDVESDLLNINRPTTKTLCNQYNPKSNKMNTTATTRSQEASFPQTFARLVDPPCTLRATGWNRWEWLCDDPQQGVMVPFDNLVTTRLSAKDQFRPCIPKPIDSNTLLPAPASNDKGTSYEGLETGPLADINASLQRAAAAATYPRGDDVLPAPPSLMGRVRPAPINPPSVALGPYGVAAQL